MNMDDAIRERHGVACQNCDHKQTTLTIGETNDYVVLFNAADDAVRYLTPVQARYIADRLYDLCRRIEGRAGSSEPPKPKTIPAAKQERRP